MYGFSRRRGPIFSRNIFRKAPSPERPFPEARQNAAAATIKEREAMIVEQKPHIDELLSQLR
jgi:hypothetical protein